MDYSDALSSGSPNVEALTCGDLTLYHEPSSSVDEAHKTVEPHPLSSNPSTDEARLRRLEQKYKQAIKRGELLTELAEVSLVPGALHQLLKLWEDDFRVDEDEEGVRVTALDGGSVKAAVKQRLAMREYAHFCLPRAHGGTAVTQVARKEISDVETGRPKNLGEALLARWKSSQMQSSKSLEKPIGLGRRKS